jgi:hypothetical protein
MAPWTLRHFLLSGIFHPIGTLKIMAQLRMSTEPATPSWTVLMTETVEALFEILVWLVGLITNKLSYEQARTCEHDTAVAPPLEVAGSKELMQGVWECP